MYSYSWPKKCSNTEHCISLKRPSVDFHIGCKHLAIFHSLVIDFYVLHLNNWLTNTLCVTYMRITKNVIKLLIWHWIIFFLLFSSSVVFSDNIVMFSDFCNDKYLYLLYKKGVFLFSKFTLEYSPTKMNHLDVDYLLGKHPKNRINRIQAFAKSQFLLVEFFFLNDWPHKTAFFTLLKLLLPEQGRPRDKRARLPAPALVIN